jgi:hypothetical protein
MAGRILNRRELRKQAEQAEQAGPPAAEGASAPLATPPPEKKARKAPAPRKPRAKKTPPRMRARWGVFDGSMHQVAIFDYNQRAAADTKLADLLAKKKGIHFLQLVKDQMPEPAPAETPVTG